MEAEADCALLDSAGSCPARDGRGPGGSQKEREKKLCLHFSFAEASEPDREPLLPSALRTLADRKDLVEGASSRPRSGSPTSTRLSLSGQIAEYDGMPWFQRALFDTSAFQENPCASREAQMYINAPGLTGPRRLAEAVETGRLLSSSSLRHAPESSLLPGVGCEDPQSAQLRAAECGVADPQSTGGCRGRGGGCGCRRRHESSGFWSVAHASLKRRSFDSHVLVGRSRQSVSFP